MSMKTLYTAQVHTVGGREGAARSSDGRIDIQLATPGSKRPGTNPEQLFAAGWSACFEGALARAAAENGLALPSDTAVDAEVNLNIDEIEGFSISARLAVSLPGLGREAAQALIDRAHAICPYSKMVRGGIEAVVALA
ncbi:MULTISPECIES: organic hydroperoxide resistance protein [unclassified Rhizobium]|uniref:organic hydroperoxide resistance protein n=1 Tax=unclassified Rhizobium TaxID=2613769 RepID=UPI00104A8E9B|nr:MULTISPECIES: organic hydroperoxide resistance protein [unclassified Rhizobium]MBB3397019.1 Ohr subfamily peroxiredoxin [Rhizobium sp. BK060]MBB4170755.1 Ohr subfamily peroxiredoxin [Rhizobium sp. BK538]TCM75975.1 Ohr subfamily peroxiredoxin [Rhizobium sp. BK068]